MNERYALVTPAGEVDSVILWNGDERTFAAPDGWTLVPEASAPASQPTAVCPDRVTRFQAKAALSRMGLLSTATSIASAAGGETLLAWNEAGHFYRNSPLILQFAALLGMDTPSEIDAFFVLADTIEV